MFFGNGVAPTLRNIRTIVFWWLYSTTITTTTRGVRAYNVHNDNNVVSLERLAKAASLSYLRLDGGRMKRSPYYVDICGEGDAMVVPVAQVVDSASESGATVFANDERIVVACRGSATLKNFATNLRFRLVPTTGLSSSSEEEDDDDHGSVHEGFRDASIGLWRELEPVLASVERSSTTNRRRDVTFTGHSLGAATALLCAYRRAESRRRTNDDAAPPRVVTFGGPRLCDAAFAARVRARLGDVTHLVHDRDPILANNQALWDAFGFENVGVERRCDPYAPRAWESHDDENSKDSNLAWNVLDHCNYLGVFVGPRI